ncbi:hypothetical protein C5167_033320 [Papaver somniferum]|uniref:Uncharacterized protein n=1 Tax=Papaver somniferum TaxID=3469 RepID=A0A4Y7KDZ3_PAPSO|nr:hypothetical protein C5167_033320 [Papaver somniferum]
MFFDVRKKTLTSALKWLLHIQCHIAFENNIRYNSSTYLDMDFKRFHSNTDQYWFQSGLYALEEQVPIWVTRKWEKLEFMFTNKVTSVDMVILEEKVFAKLRYNMVADLQLTILRAGRFNGGIRRMTANQNLETLSELPRYITTKSEWVLPYYGTTSVQSNVVYLMKISLKITWKFLKIEEA